MTPISSAVQQAARAPHEEICMHGPQLVYDACSPAPAAWMCRTCGAELQDACDPIRPGCGVDAELVTARLESAGATLMAMRSRSAYPSEYGSGWPAVVRDFHDAYGWTGEPCRPATPSAREISSMDATYAWLPLIPRANYVLRRVVAARSLVHPSTGRHVLSYRRIARLLHCDHEAVRSWHARGIRILVEALQRREA